MEFTNIKNFFSSYSIATISISIAVTLIVFLISLFWKNIPRLLKAYAPIILAVVLEFAYDMIFIRGEFIFTVEAFSTGLVSGSLATVFMAFINKIKNGQDFSFDASVILIEEILSSYLKGENKKLAVETILSILKDDLKEEKQMLDEVCAVIKKYSADGFTHAEILAISELIIQTADSLKPKEK